MTPMAQEIESRLAEIMRLVEGLDLGSEVATELLQACLHLQAAQRLAEQSEPLDSTRERV